MDAPPARRRLKLVQARTKGQFREARNFGSRRRHSEAFVYTAVIALSLLPAFGGGPGAGRAEPRGAPPSAAAAAREILFHVAHARSSDGELLQLRGLLSDRNQ